MPTVREAQEMLLAASDVLSRCPFLSLVCGELMARWAGSTYLFLLPSSSAMNCRHTCLPSKCPCSVLGETKDHQLQPGVAVCQGGGAVLPMAWDPPRLKPRYYAKMYLQVPTDVNWPNPLTQTWQRDLAHPCLSVCVWRGGLPLFQRCP